MGKAIVITIKNVNVSYTQIIWGATFNIFTSGLSGQDFQTLCFVADKVCNWFVISHVFLPNVSTVVCYSNNVLLMWWSFQMCCVHGFFAENLSNSCNFSSTGTHHWVFFFWNVLPHVGASPFLVFLAMVNSTHLIALQLCQILEENMMMTWWEASDAPQGPCNALILLRSMNSESKWTFLEVQGRIPRQIKAVSEKRNIQEIVNDPQQPCT